MSVHISHLTKLFGEQAAVNDISFAVNPGEILGFLGPNGAGKSTTMKIITGYIPQTSGSATVCGFDVEKQSLDVRRHIGYLPENNPLYTDMYIKEYLEFVARLHGMKSFGKRVEEMIALTGLTPERKKKIGQLSKGYRQRVGLAQAMLHNPDVLILDEPTSGLDPNQLVEVRNLIKQLGKEKTVILSTHIMQEVQAICNRAIIINKGVIVADDTVDALRNTSADTSIINATFKETVEIALIKKLQGVTHVKHIGNSQFIIQYSGNADMREQLFRFAVDNQLTLLNLQIERQELEDIFQQLTSGNKINL
ncbi:MAG: gliding motility-associated ABC transporter ATP-binding subunit GldA [Chitinophagales bacterium]|nr:gliding motility-associated ABC transporter ATP-binding subunit GldA [Bacteroidota bacterium]MBP7398452.1 gliding motility-associated ABC transporter ATP-binding subunit GldA [Chitinophagales bacterium]MBK8489195.1 gliding motility-associated ABC transporter ATP-binding subunit GldA [Bacteroidota bacterium]MBK8681046.1 gliding motility-associated ABC transporter ATP-binding subunit GldA [Bacteroidota bacterium]MBP8753413.1 gliding motility-associated ABC transporter ATP-binding subunit GldA 